MHFAAKYLSRTDLDELVKLGADLTIKNKKGKTPLAADYPKRIFWLTTGLIVSAAGIFLAMKNLNR